MCRCVFVFVVNPRVNSTLGTNSSEERERKPFPLPFGENLQSFQQTFPYRFFPWQRKAGEQVRTLKASVAMDVSPFLPSMLVLSFHPIRLTIAATTANCEPLGKKGTMTSKRSASSLFNHRLNHSASSKSVFSLHESKRRSSLQVRSWCAFRRKYHRLHPQSPG